MQPPCEHSRSRGPRNWMALKGRLNQRVKTLSVMANRGTPDSPTSLHPQHSSITIQIVLFSDICCVLQEHIKHGSSLVVTPSKTIGRAT
jgi:hypothetical protein